MARSALSSSSKHVDVSICSSIWHSEVRALFTFCIQMGKHFPEGSPVRLDIETAMEGIPIVRLLSRTLYLPSFRHHFQSTPIDGNTRRVLTLIVIDICRCRCDVYRRCHLSAIDFAFIFLVAANTIFSLIRKRCNPSCTSKSARPATPKAAPPSWPPSRRRRMRSFRYTQPAWLPFLYSFSCLSF